MMMIPEIQLRYAEVPLVWLLPWILALLSATCLVLAIALITEPPLPTGWFFLDISPLPCTPKDRPALFLVQSRPYFPLCFGPRGNFPLTHDSLGKSRVLPVTLYLINGAVGPVLSLKLEADQVVFWTAGMQGEESKPPKNDTEKGETTHVILFSAHHAACTVSFCVATQIRTTGRNPLSPIPMSDWAVLIGKSGGQEVSFTRNPIHVCPSYDSQKGSSTHGVHACQ